jgi:NADPH:quinone reductase-like Zn-dependent oxidoreductase
MDTVLVTGGTGNIGAAFVALLGRHTTSFTKFAVDHAPHFGEGGGD